ncbi:MAG: hypothetical protein ACM31C_12725 [Acidobacteriota bacterium]
MTRLGLALVLGFGLGACACANKHEAPPAQDKAPAMAPEEIQRSRDACQAYVDRVCACADKLAAVKQQCGLAKALPDAIRLGLEVAASPDSSKDDVLQAQASVRKAVKECIEQTAKLPSLGCPAT